MGCQKVKVLKNLMHTLYLDTVSIFGLFSKGGSDVGENKGWIQQTKCDELPCPEMCSSGWQYSDGNAWNIDASMKPTCGKILHLKDSTCIFICVIKSKISLLLW